MLKKVISFLGICALGLGLSKARAQTRRPLTLHQAEQAALKNHPEIFAAHYNALAQNQVVRESQSAYFPTMEADFTGSGADRNG
ncbi:MAG: hypothetical protein ACRD2B_05080, partial [Terriglobia bacterium]